MKQIFTTAYCKQRLLRWRIQDLTLGGVDFVNGVGGGVKKSLKVLTVEVKVIFEHVLALFILQLGLKFLASE